MFQRTVFGLGLLMVMTLVVAATLASENAVARADVTAILATTTDAGATGSNAAEAVKSSDKKGKYYFKKICKSCHGQGDEGGELTPMSKTIKQWERVFRKDRHIEGEAFSKKFDGTQLLHIQTFLVNHAADSDQPETCG